jgi:hypothetical protein
MSIWDILLYLCLASIALSFICKLLLRKLEGKTAQEKADEKYLRKKHMVESVPQIVDSVIL